MMQSELRKLVQSLRLSGGNRQFPSKLVQILTILRRSIVIDGKEYGDADGQQSIDNTKDKGPTIKMQTNGFDDDYIFCNPTVQSRHQVNLSWWKTRSSYVMARRRLAVNVIAGPLSVTHRRLYYLH